MKDIRKELIKRYNKNIDICKIWSSKYKDVYSFSLLNKKYVASVNKRKSITREYKVVLSNELQQGLYFRGFNTADVFDFFKTDKKQLVFVSSFLEGKSFSELDDIKIYKIGELVAKLHILTCQENVYINKYSNKYYLCRATACISRFVRNIKDIINYNIHKLPSGICHQDLTLNNFIFGEDKVYLIDFDKHRKLPYVQEIYRFLRGDNKKFASSFLYGYVSVRQLNDAEKEFLTKKGFTL